ncbi:hypothetical protein ANANG_G00305410 [Anguilla anguilla]|uniref:nucleoside diphosphate phosphatase n=1 Tax=Anguilla anguilla TaxID=7936 RepID=A0A9D3RIJ5_ANGAN|nr:hypothetical protein ANANG_G00305410 [Anguilla anguilla]
MTRNGARLSLGQTAARPCHWDNMKFPKLSGMFLLLTSMMVYLTCVTKPVVSKPVPPPNSPDLSKDRFQYGIMMDAGSTGTRIHVFKFQLGKNGAPTLSDAKSKAINPGLSAYADNPDECSKGIQELLDFAKTTVPESQRKSTRLVLKATAGLRLLPKEKADRLLDKVREVFKESPFPSRKDSVSIMDGTEEGTAAWITINFLIDKLNGPDKSTVGVLDLGGGSMQITFTPQDPNQKSTQTTGYITPFQMFKHHHTLYSRSYLGLGLMSARLAILGGVEGQPQGGTEMVSPCLAPESSVQWNHAGVDYTVKGQKAVPGKSIYESCREKVEKVLSSKNVEKVKEAKGKDFYAISAFYHRAQQHGVNAENNKGIKVNDYLKDAEKVCSMAKPPPKHPFLCLDLTYISVLLQGLGFPNKELKLVKKIKGKDTSWALGATLLDMNSQST